MSAQKAMDNDYGSEGGFGDEIELQKMTMQSQMSVPGDGPGTARKRRQNKSLLSNDSEVDLVFKNEEQTSYSNNLKNLLYAHEKPTTLLED